MIRFRQLVCPVSSEHVDENIVRATALLVIFTMGAFLLTGQVIFPVLLTMDFFIRAFTRLKYSPLSWLGRLFVRMVGTGPVLIDKAPKIFAARAGFMLSSLTAVFALLGLPVAAGVTGATLVMFAFMECVLNFCAGCWIFTYVVVPLAKRN